LLLFFVKHIRTYAEESSAPDHLAVGGNPEIEKAGRIKSIAIRQKNTPVRAGAFFLFNICNLLRLS